MSQRHPHDTVEKPWVGAATKGDPRYCPLELRDLAATVPPDVEERMRRDVFSTPTMVAAFDGGRRVVTLNPRDSTEDAETAVTWKKVAWAATQLRGQHVEEVQAAYDAVRFTCSACGVVVPFDTRQRTLVDGRSAHVCGRCLPVVNQIALDALAGERLPSGQTRAEAARMFLERSAP